MANPTPRHVHVLVGIAVTTFSFSPILVRFAAEAPGMVVAVWRTLIALALLTPFALTRVGPELRRFGRRDVLLVLASGVLLGLHFVTWIESLYHTTVASASVLLSTAPIFVAAFGYLFLKERLSPTVTAAIIVSVLGAVLIGWSDARTLIMPNNILGNSLALGAALTLSFYLLIGRVIRRGASWIGYVYPLYIVAALTTLAFALSQGIPLLGYSPAVYGLCALMALGPQILGHGSFNYAVKYVSATVLALLGLLEPIGASIMALFLFDEAPQGWALVGMVIVLCAVAFALWAMDRERAAGTA